MEEFETSYAVHELGILTHLHKKPQTNFIHDCLDCFPNSCHLTDILSMPLCLTFPTQA